ncbi:MAG TPA: MerR family transcriptional regulator [Solirubrobacteraceae bacterium]|nr:MerR family transcriptional regulator [Solirubrobacteraceae bacterium]
MANGTQFTIGEIASRAGVAASAIRYYESIGLLPERERGQRRDDDSVLGRLAFIGVAQSAGFKLPEIKELVGEIDDGSGMSASMRVLSARKLDEVEELLVRTRAMKGWLEVAKECGCASPDECSLFPDQGEGVADPAAALELVHVAGRDCRRP